MPEEKKQALKIAWSSIFMGIILKTGIGTKKIRILVPIGKRIFKTLKEEKGYNGTIKIEKTNSAPVNNTWLIEQYKFGYYDETGQLRSYFLGNPYGKEDFYLQEVRSMRAGIGTTRDPLKFIAKKAGIRLSKLLGIKRNNHCNFSFERNMLYLWNYTKDYLKEKGIQKIITQAEFEIVDTAEMDMKIGWRDMDRTRKLEQYVGNKAERKKHLTFTERFCGNLYLEYPLNRENKN